MKKKKSSLVLHLVIEGEPATKKNSEHIVTSPVTGKQFIVPDARYSIWQADKFPVVRDWMALQIQKHQLIFPLAQIRIKALFFFKTLRRKDGPGVEQALLDLLQETRLLGNDEWTQLDGFSWQPFLARTRPRIEMWIHVLNAERSSWEDLKIKNIQRKNRKYARSPKAVKDIIT